MMKKSTKWSVLSLLVIIVGLAIFVVSIMFGGEGMDGEGASNNDGREYDYKVDIQTLSFPETPQELKRSSRFSSTLSSRLNSGKSCRVQLSDGGVYDVKDSTVLRSMLESDDRDLQMMALYTLVRSPDLPDTVQPALFDTLLGVYNELVAEYPWDKKETIKASIIKSCFTVIMFSDDPKAKKVLEEAENSDKKLLKELAEAYKQRVRKTEKYKKRMGRKENPKPPPEILSDAKNSRNEEFVAALRNVMEQGTTEQKHQVLYQLYRQRGYLRSEDGKEKRGGLISLLKKQYSSEDTSLALKEDIVMRLGRIAKEEEVRPFIEKIANDDDIDEVIRDDAEMALRIWNAQHNGE